MAVTASAAAARGTTVRRGGMAAWWDGMIGRRTQVVPREFTVFTWGLNCISHSRPGREERQLAAAAMTHQRGLAGRVRGGSGGEADRWIRGKWRIGRARRRNTGWLMGQGGVGGEDRTERAGEIGTRIEEVQINKMPRGRGEGGTPERRDSERAGIRAPGGAGNEQRIAEWMAERVGGRGSLRARKRERHAHAVDGCRAKPWTWQRGQTRVVQRCGRWERKWRGGCNGLGEEEAQSIGGTRGGRTRQERPKGTRERGVENGSMSGNGGIKRGCRTDMHIRVAASAKSHGEYAVAETEQEESGQGMPMPRVKRTELAASQLRASVGADPPNLCA
ncbi:hypothetical protein DFH09DRAFT_1445163 [Mycena vulgaris]|nr:hypothetical protein DFH09DRAFT_1445163 [Mycena vulgaris]